jgi:DNA repair protein RecO (recombination protein O)
LRYQEKSLIVKCFTEAAGLKSYFIHSAFSGKSGHKISYFQPRTIIDIEASHKNKGTLESIREIRLAFPYQTVSTDIVKSTIVMFVSEVLHHSIREEEKNEDLFQFLETALHWLDTHDECANFHLILLMEATKFLGFYPDTTLIEADYFEMIEGRFSEYHAISCLNDNETSLLKKLLGLRFSGSQKIFNASERQTLLKILLDYYSMHLEGFTRPKSVEVLREVFA